MATCAAAPSQPSAAESEEAAAARAYSEGVAAARAPEPAAVAAARAYLGHHLRCGLSDGRAVVGKFACFDKQQNILLNEAREWRWDAAKVRSERMVGTVIVPRQHLMSCHVLVEHKEAPEAAG